MQICESKRGITIKISRADLEEAAKLREQHGTDAFIRHFIQTACKGLPHYYYLGVQFFSTIPAEEIKFPVGAKIENVRAWDVCEGSK